MDMFFDYLLTSIAIGITFLYGCTGEILTEKAGHLNLGIPGIMCIGGACGCLTLKFVAGMPPFLVVLLAIIATFLGGALMGAIYRSCYDYLRRRYDEVYYVRSYRKRL